MAKLIISVCGLLQSLCHDIISLVASFKALNSIIIDLIKQHRDMAELASDIETDLLDGAVAPEQRAADPRDLVELRDKLHEMRRLAIRVNAMAALYAALITDVINPGFSKVVEAAYDDGGGGAESAVVVYEKQKGMGGYLTEAKTACAARERAAEVRLVQCLREADEAHEARRAMGSRTGTGSRGGGIPAPRRAGSAATSAGDAGSEGGRRSGRGWRWPFSKGR